VEYRWDLSISKNLKTPLDECVYGSRLIGSDPALVLHGGGNTSVKAPYADITGTTTETLFVKGSGWDLATIEPQGFAPLTLPRLQDLLALESLSDPDMMRELMSSSFDPAAPAPSVESLLHAFIPHPAILHSHADAIVSLTNVGDSGGYVHEIFGDSVVVIPYVMPGFDLAKTVATSWPDQTNAGTIGMVLLNHGLFTFGETTHEAYVRHHELISKAERWLAENAPLPASTAAGLPDLDTIALAGLRRDVSEAAGQPMLLCRHCDQVSTRFVQRKDLESLATRGPLTPDHVIRTKRIPLVGRDVAAYTTSYEDYFREHEHRGRTELTMLDPAPRVVVDPEFGVLTAGRTIAAADIAFDIYEHTMPALERVEDNLDRYEALDAGHIFDVEYWDLEQAKLRLAGPPAELAGMVAVVTGAASGIGRACAAELLARGCAVGGIDIDPGVASTFDSPAWLGLAADVSDPEAQAAAIADIVERFGGLDIVLVAAGIFGKSTPISGLDAENYRIVQAVNVDAVVNLLHTTHPFLARSPVGGRVSIIGSKNVAAPGKGALSYSTSKAALSQVARVATLEWADDAIRVNTVHPDAVFDTGLWNDELLRERADNYGLTVDEYKTRNLLRTEITSAGVARVAVELCTDTFSATTGAHIPIDGGNERVV
jgi:rhamnose utilization protein RhaD (predicted bifunctional aldolase and dehydrogenase)/NAD(P)-dependent dehydrogenase (short-subunit alcohol dehydrogenase family)